MYTVYKIVFSNGKCYIGITSNLRLRINAHKCRMKDMSCHYPLYEAFRKYGFDSVEWLVIKEFETLQEAEKLEIELIKTETPNYNLASGGMVHEMTDEIKDKISKANSGRIQTEEQKRKRSESLKLYYKDRPKIEKKESNKKMSEQACRNMKASRDKKREERILKILFFYRDGMALKTLSSITGIPIRTICMYTEEWRTRYAKFKAHVEDIKNV